MPDGTRVRRSTNLATVCQSRVMLPVTIYPRYGMPTASISAGRSAIRPPLLLPGPPPSCAAETNMAAAFSPPT